MRRERLFLEDILTAAAAVGAAPAGSIAEMTPGMIAAAERMTYKVALKQTEEGYSVWCPGLPGCWSQGATEEEAVNNIRDAIREYMEALGDQCAEAELREVEVPV